MNNLRIFDFLQTEAIKQYLFTQSQKNKEKKQRKQSKIITEANKKNKMYYFGIDKEASPKYNINYFKYYLEYYIIEYLRERKTKEANKL